MKNEKSKVVANYKVIFPWDTQA